MKKLVEAAIPEKAFYICDVTGQRLGMWGPAAILEIQGGFHSQYDGEKFELHLSPEVAEVVLPLIRVLLLNGAPLRQHLVESLFRPGEKEPAIRRNLRDELLQKLDGLVVQSKGLEERNVLSKSHARYLLPVMISRLSEDWFGSGWHTNIEFHLWSGVVGKTPRYAFREEELALLFHLSEIADGWAYFGADGAAFIGRKEWNIKYQRWIKTQPPLSPKTKKNLKSTIGRLHRFTLRDAKRNSDL